MNNLKRTDCINLFKILLFLFVSADILFIFLHIIFKFFEIPNAYLFFIENDSGYAEFYQYLKELWIVFLLVFLFLKTWWFGFLFWALLFLYVLIDDAFLIHENYGFLISKRYNIPSTFGLRPEDIGELIVTLGIVSFFLVIILLFYVRGSEFFKIVSLNLIILIILLAIFGVLFDMLRIVIAVKGIGILEDGGEMVVMSLIVTYLIYANLNPINSSHIALNPRLIWKKIQRKDKLSKS